MLWFPLLLILIPVAVAADSDPEGGSQALAWERWHRMGCAAEGPPIAFHDPDCISTVALPEPIAAADACAELFEICTWSD